MSRDPAMNHEDVAIETRALTKVYGRGNTEVIALRDATIHNGCMSFLPGTHKMLDIEPVNLVDPQDLHAIAPQTKGLKPVTCELEAGSSTVHNGMTFHYAGPNRSDGMREAIAAGRFADFHAATMAGWAAGDIPPL